MFKVLPASLQTVIDTPNCVLVDRVQYSTVHIPNIFCDGHLQIINCVGIVRIHLAFHRTPGKKSGAQRIFDQLVVCFTYMNVCLISHRNFILVHLNRVLRQQYLSTILHY
jgi:hypothetical protein